MRLLNKIVSHFGQGLAERLPVLLQNRSENLLRLRTQANQQTAARRGGLQSLLRILSEVQIGIAETELR